MRTEEAWSAPGIVFAVDTGYRHAFSASWTVFHPRIDFTYPCQPREAGPGLEAPKPALEAVGGGGHLRVVLAAHQVVPTDHERPQPRDGPQDPVQVGQGLLVDVPGDLRRGQGRPGLDAEVAVAVGAPVGHRLVAGLAGIGAAALSAGALPRPVDGLEPVDGRLLVRKQRHHLHEAQALAEVHARCRMCHPSPPSCW